MVFSCEKKACRTHAIITQTLHWFLYASPQIEIGYSFTLIQMLFIKTENSTLFSLYLFVCTRGGFAVRRGIVI